MKKPFTAIFLPVLMTCLLNGEEVRWNTSFKEAYLCHARGKQVAFQVRLPPKAESLKMYPLIVTLKGGLKFTPTNELPFIQVKPSGGGIWGYRSMSTCDVIQVIAYMKMNYPVDPDRIYLVGSSAGASGAMHLASIYADQFAAVIPMVAMGNNYPLINFRNLPVEVHHGDRDWTSSICNARVQYQKMKTLGCPVVLKEYKGVGHSVPRPHDPIAKWLLEQKRNPVPRSISHRCESATQGQCYWLRICEFQDPHEVAEVEAFFEDGVVTVRPVNISAFTVNLKILSNVTALKIDDTVYSGELSGNQLKVRFHDGRWGKDAISKPPGRPYYAGAAANLYQGEPLLLVYGTRRPESTERLRMAAENLATCGGPVSGRMKIAFPVVSDTALSPKQKSTYNLILIGSPEDNLITKAMFPGFPISIDNGKLKAGERPLLPLKDQVVSLLYRNPENPDRLIYMIAPYIDDDGLTRFAKSPQYFLSDSDGFDRISAADLVVQNLDRQIARAMQFDKNWDWISVPGSDRMLPSGFVDRTRLARIYLKIMREKSGADYAFWWGPADRGMWGVDFNFLKNWNPDFYTEADFRTQHGRIETMSASLSGAEIERIRDRWGRGGELISDPPFSDDANEKEDGFRVVIPMDLYIKLGRRRKNLTDPRPGPIIESVDIRQILFPSNKTVQQ